MKKHIAIPLVLVTSMGLSVIRADDAPLTDPAQHVRIAYNKLNTPDEVIFKSLLNRIRTFTEHRSEEQLESWVFSEMNLTWSSEREAWLAPQIVTLRHTREEIRDFVALLVEVANESFVTVTESHRSILCPSEKLDTQAKRVEALNKRDEEDRLYEAYYFDYVLEQIGEQAGADLRTWLSREKQGFASVKFNYQTLWAGRESKLAEQLSKSCASIGGDR